MPIKLPFVLKVSTALERHGSWNYLDFCGYFFSDGSSGQIHPDTNTVGIRQLVHLWLWTGLAKDFKSCLDAGEQLRLFSGNWCGHISAENKSGISSVSPRGPRGSVTLLMALIRRPRFPQKWSKVELTFSLTSEEGKIGREKNPEPKCFIISSMLIAWSVLGKVHLFITWETAYNFLKALVLFMHLSLLSRCYSVWPKTESVWR